MIVVAHHTQNLHDSQAHCGCDRFRRVSILLFPISRFRPEPVRESPRFPWRYVAPRTSFDSRESEEYLGMVDFTESMNIIVLSRMLTVLLAIPISFLTLSPTASVSEGDEEFTRINYPEAISKYESVLQTSPVSADVLWRLARVYVCMGDVVEKDKKEGLYRKAEQYARQCVAADERVSEGHTWLAAALGNIAMFEGSETKVKLCNDIKRELDRALVLNPNNDIAYSILGSFYRALGNVSWVERQLANVFLGSLPSGGYEEAEIVLKKAISVAPHVMRHSYELGMLYFQWDRPDDAKRAFEQARKQPILLASDRRKLARIKETLANLEQDTH